MCGKFCFLIFVMCLAKNVVLGSPICQSCNRNSYPYIGTETPYSYVHNDIGETMTLPNCKPTQIWMLCRHGTQYPDEDTIAQILNLTHIRDQIKTTCMCMHSRRKRYLENWTPYPELIPKMGKHLTVQGEKDLVSLAKRIRMKLSLFKKDTTKSFEFESTVTQSTIVSMKSFIEGAFDIKLQITNDSQFKSRQPTIYMKPFGIKLQIAPNSSNNEGMSFLQEPVHTAYPKDAQKIS